MDQTTKASECLEEPRYRASAQGALPPPPQHINNQRQPPSMPEKCSLPNSEYKMRDEQEDEYLRQAQQASKAAYEEELQAQEDRAFILEKLGRYFPDLDPDLVASILLEAPDAATASDTLRDIQASKDPSWGRPHVQYDNPDSHTQKEHENLKSQLEASQATVKELLEEELPKLMQQLQHSHTIMQEMLESEFPNLTTKVVAVTLRDHDNDVASTRAVLKGLSQDC